MITIIPNVMNSVITIGAPHIMITFAFLCNANIIRATNRRLMGNIVSISSSYIASETSCNTGVRPVIVTASRGGMTSDLSGSHEWVGKLYVLLHSSQSSGRDSSWINWSAYERNAL